jgi:hypothetical protein
MPLIHLSMDIPFYISEEELKFTSGFKQSGWYTNQNGPFKTKQEAEKNQQPTK